jgi:hypothetical protein
MDVQASYITEEQNEGYTNNENDRYFKMTVITLTNGNNAFQRNDIQIFELSHNSCLCQKVFTVFCCRTGLEKKYTFSLVTYNSYGKDAI